MLEFVCFEKGKRGFIGPNSDLWAFCGLGVFLFKQPLPFVYKTLKSNPNDQELTRVNQLGSRYPVIGFIESSHQVWKLWFTLFWRNDKKHWVCYSPYCFGERMELRVHRSTLRIITLGHMQAHRGKGSWSSPTPPSGDVDRYVGDIFLSWVT